MKTFSGHSNATKSLGTSTDKNFLVSVFFFYDIAWMFEILDFQWSQYYTRKTSL